MIPKLNVNPAIEFIFFEHLLLCIRMLISYAVNETPNQTHRLLARQDYLVARVFNEGWKSYYRNGEDDESDDEAHRASAECVAYKAA
eukprot:IDg19525t1